ncbi:MAG TPA: MFS transporter [Candidatus Gastranaerophilales bacterium]|nr:MFS transporter [Candidatus Gastranaerophilales bacterium]
MSNTLSQKKLPEFTIWQFINLCMGAVGLQFAWSMQIQLTGRVTEPLGATPLILGLIWLAGPITGIIVQPIVGAISDNMWTGFGRRRPFLLVGAILGSLALVGMPYSPTLLMAASMLWIIDICVNVSQGPHRALIPDNVPSSQTALANSFISFGFGLGAVIAFGFPFILKEILNYQIGIKEQFIVGAVALTTAMLWTVITTPENNKPEPSEDVKKDSPFESIKMFLISSLISGGILAVAIFAAGFPGQFDPSNSKFIQDALAWFVLILSFPMLGMALKSFYTPEIGKLCSMQYFTWLGIMCLFIYFNNYVVHNIYLTPDLTEASQVIKDMFEPTVLEATNLSGIALAAFNLVCVIVSIPLGILCNKFGKKNVHAFALTCMGLAFLGAAFFAKTPAMVVGFIALAGIGWASTLTIPFALLMDNMKKGKEGSSLGKFNLFVAGPQILSSIAVGYLINRNPVMLESGGSTHHWEYSLIVAGGALILAALVALTLKREMPLEQNIIETQEQEKIPATV